MADKDLIELMMQTAAKLRTELEKEQRLHTLQTIEEQKLLLANALALLRRIPASNGTIGEDIRRHREIISNHLSRVA